MFKSPQDSYTDPYDIESQDLWVWEIDTLMFMLNYMAVLTLREIIKNDTMLQMVLVNTQVLKRN
jgi:hypothetical protein